MVVPAFMLHAFSLRAQPFMWGWDAAGQGPTALIRCHLASKVTRTPSAEQLVGGKRQEFRELLRQRHLRKKLRGFREAALIVNFGADSVAHLAHLVLHD